MLLKGTKSQNYGMKSEIKYMIFNPSFESRPHAICILSYPQSLGTVSTAKKYVESGRDGKVTEEKVYRGYVLYLVTVWTV